MKKLFALLSSVAMVATLLSGCTTEPEINEIPSVTTHSISVVADLDTRTYYDGTSQIKWSTDDVLTLIEIDANGAKAPVESDAIKIDANGKATFHFNLTGTTSGNLEYRAILISKNHEDDSRTEYPYLLRNIQDAQLNSFDPRADILVAEPVTNLDERPNSLTMKFARCVAVNKMKLTGLQTQKADIRSVSFHTPSDGVPLAGAVSFDYENNTVNYNRNTYDDAYCNHGITAVYGGNEVAKNGEFTVYFTSFPATLERGFIVEVYTARNRYYREVTFSGNQKLELKNNALNSFSVSMESADIKPLHAEVFKVVSDVANLNDGDNVIITIEDVSQVMGRMTNSSKKAGVAIPASDVNTTQNTVSVDEETALILTVHNNTDGTISFLNTTNNNYLKGTDKNFLNDTGSDIDNDTSWNITIDNNNRATIQSVSGATNNRQILVNTNTFSNYQYGANFQYVRIYKSVINEGVPQILISRSDAPAVIPASGGTYTVSYVTTTAMSDDNISVRDYNGCVSDVVINTDEKTIVFSVDANTSDEPRTGSIVLGGTPSAAYGNDNHTVTELIEITQAPCLCYDLVTSLADITTGEYIIVSASPLCYLKNNAINSVGTLVDYIAGQETIEGTINADMVWNFYGDASGLTIYNGNTYLYSDGGTNNSLELSNVPATWNVTNGKSEGLFYVTVGNQTLETFNGAWTTYSGQGDYYAVYLYKRYVDPAKAKPTVAFINDANQKIDQYIVEALDTDEQLVETVVEGAETVTLKVYRNASCTDEVANPENLTLDYDSGIVVFNFNSFNLGTGSRNYWLKLSATNFNGTSEAVLRITQKKFNAPELTLTGATAAATDTSVNLSYAITNPIEGGTISVTNAPTWVTNSTINTDNITLTILANTDSEERIGDITIAYNYSIAGTAQDPITATATLTQSAAGSSASPVTYTLSFPDDNKDNNKKSVYTDSWTAIKDGLTWNIANFNNNSWNNDWTYIKCGQKKNASVATITTQSAIVASISTVKVNIGAITVDKVNSIKLYVSANSDFSSATEYVIDKSVGEKTVNITSPAANRYYKIEFNCASGSNGVVQVNSVVLSGIDGSTDPNPGTGSGDPIKGATWDSGTLKVETSGVTVSGNASDNNNGIQLAGKNGASVQYVINTYSDYIETVTLQYRTNTSAGNATATVKIGNTDLLCGDNVTGTTTIGNSSHDMTFTVPNGTLLKGDVTVNMTATSNSVYLEKVIIN